MPQANLSLATIWLEAWGQVVGMRSVLDLEYYAD